MALSRQSFRNVQQIGNIGQPLNAVVISAYITEATPKIRYSSIYQAFSNTSPKRCHFESPCLIT